MVVEIEKKKTFLKRYKKNLAKIRRVEEKIEFINDKMINLKAVRISDEPKGTSSISQAELLSDKILYEERLTYLKNKSQQFKKEIIEVIYTLDDTRYIEVLEAFFIECLTFEQIADKLGYNKRWIIRLYGKALGMIVIKDTKKPLTVTSE